MNGNHFYMGHITIPKDVKIVFRPEVMVGEFSDDHFDNSFIEFLLLDELEKAQVVKMMLESIKKSS